LLAVFDGHGGSAASQFCSDWLSSYIRKKNEYYPENMALAVKSAFTRIDRDFISSGLLDGTTACAVTIAGKRVTCCNSGDSRAIIVKRDGSVVPLSDDHKPDRNDETKRINELGGRVIYWGRWRVEGVLAVSRSIGDAKLKPYVTAEPDIVEYDLGEMTTKHFSYLLTFNLSIPHHPSSLDDDDMFLVVASDGVWDTMSNDLVAKFVIVNSCNIVNKSLQVDDKLLRWIARQVSDLLSFPTQF
jgi:serine/threonine protein phosphatase PrpC